MRMRPVALVFVVLLAGCGRRGETPGISGQDVASPGPIGHRDSLMNSIKPELKQWVAMWRAALPGFQVDSLRSQPRERWTPVAVQGLESDPDSTRAIMLGVQSPDECRILDIDSYQWFRINGDSVEVGGEPDSRPRLFDYNARTVASVAFCGTPCGYHWGRWLSPDQFVLGGWEDADELGRSKKGALFVYDLRDSTVASYETRVVSSEDYERYFAAWKRWLIERTRDSSSVCRAPPSCGPWRL